jgi:hypothetical protein
VARLQLSPAELAEALPAAFPELPATKLREYAEQFVTAFTASIYKWVQAPLSLHVGSLDLERERALQLPVVQRTEWGWHTILPDALGVSTPAPLPTFSRHPPAWICALRR